MFCSYNRIMINNHSERINFKRLKCLKKVPVSLQVFCRAPVPWMIKKLRVTSLLIILVDREWDIGNGYSSVYSETMILPNSMGMEKCRGHQQATRTLGAFLFIPPHCVWTYLRPNSFVGRILVDSRLSLVRHNFGLIFAIPIITWCYDSDALTTRAENTSPVGSDEKASYSSLFSGVV